MTPPEAPQDGKSAIQRDRPPAVSSCLQTLKKRADFLRASRARHQAAPGFVVQMRARRSDELPESPGVIRIGFTCSKKVGNAVARNRAKRRLRALAQTVLPEHGRPGHDYVLIGRKEATATRPFAQMQADLIRALAKLQGADK